MSPHLLVLLIAAVVVSCACTSQRPFGTTPEAAASAAAASAPPASPQAQQTAQRGALTAVDLLEAGNEAQAVAELQRALAVDPNNRLAQNLSRQIGADPVALLGRESFAYTLQPNETLSRIAERYLHDVYAFYILARYNNIKVPRQVAGGQVIRVPSKGGQPPPVAPAPAPPVAASPAPAAPPPATTAPAPAAPPPAAAPGEPAMRSAEAAERAGDLDRALTEYERAASLTQADAPQRAEQVRQKLVARHTAGARSALAKQDLDTSIRQWNRVLELDPGNQTARLERQRALALKAKVDTLK
jgi:tetratricopeptide (TPR) repeat protein